MSDKQQQQQQQSGLAGQIAAAESSGDSEAKDTPTLADLFSLLKEFKTDVDKRLSHMDEKIDTNNAYLNGTYYAQLADIWGGTSVEFNGAAKKLRTYREKDGEAIRVYNSEESRREIKYEETTYPKSSLFPAVTLSRAHGCPNDITCSLTWGPNLELITGYNVEGEETCLLLNEDFRYFVEGQNPEMSDEDTTNTPFKALSWNFLKVPEHHEKHFDKVAYSSSFSMILAPVWNPAVEWKPGTPYSLIVAATPETYKWLIGTAPPSKLSPPIQMGWLSEANDAELQMATEFLSLTVKANADLLVEHGEALQDAVKKLKDAMDPEEGDDPANELEKVLISIENGVIPSELFSTKSESTKTNRGSDAKLKKKVAEKINVLTKKVGSLQGVRKTFTEKKIVFVPEKKASVKDGARILKVDLEKYFDEEGKDFIPDPYLWALKAASSWGGYKSQKSLMACDVYGPGGGKTQNDDSDDMMEDPPSEITVMGNGVGDDERSVSFLSMSSASVCTTYSDGDENPVAVTP
mmetsp:Transcript_22979/g.54525  ORF Transcript_22979/g.54525 Transcript_22979/m.54525 type:complete len:521 (-) Transcript_22979:282-1844(-)|eukprot:CAMPEP_0113444206 /NCGR_PEP_ID=MMETSP0014_2-20120614/2546_1 /TAXON_ID=2857 /ORGANISM="Nitzschia sp." /LENGTH=520 /DNA_ID=CAMNT_0000335209 /DNA_START=104 /DNA_END=1666 /DNA_ORIENTATION=+ /assembly_acc=CAM_ASM_000159